MVSISYKSRAQYTERGLIVWLFNGNEIIDCTYKCRVVKYLQTKLTFVCTIITCDFI